MRKMLHNVACRALIAAMKDLEKDPILGEVYKALPPPQQIDMALKIVNVQRQIITVIHYVLPMLIALIALLKK